MELPAVLSPIANSKKFNLNASAVAGFFGGEEAITAMATVHLYRGRRWLGWYNSPGSYIIAKEFGRISRSRFWNGLFPGSSHHDPAVAFRLDGKTGPKYVASHSGTVMQQTGHLAHLLTQGTDHSVVPPMLLPSARDATTSLISIVTVPDINYDNLSMQTIRISNHHAVLASFPILVSVGTCILSALFADWYCFAMIFLGIISSGVTCFVIGSGDLDIETVKTPAEGSPVGDGMLLINNNVFILKGKEKDVNVITKGKFVLKLKGKPEYTAIGLCSLLLEVQFLLQLLLIPQGSLIGQTMFLTSIIASWAYNSFLASLDEEKLQRKLFYDTIKLRQPAVLSFKASTRTIMAVFTCFVLCEDIQRPLQGVEPMNILLELVPNETPVWQKWREQVVAQVKKKKEGETIDFQSGNVDMLVGLDDHDKTLLANLLQDAEDAYKGYTTQRRATTLHPTFTATMGIELHNFNM
ncbi:uncharacterized protein HD556DRAFT_1358903 [Suillus plorans]|uniref:Uncharacterized protein n=1 Tax=Suillus plorans TaxID=116603 RepID=A0A9P7ATQ2_9AGAM|nr:uncharacterized protein HD556DRAFT_1358903 [Suillus plorans]KAG1796627.1 hypothetical protein HD556DRAFT_1358903 [Suillus plorans]